MNTIAKRIGLLSVASACFIGGATSPALAGKKYTCEMNGTWIEDKDSFAFVADYYEMSGPDYFTGVYVNSSAGATAKVRGDADKGTWTIVLTYTDAKHSGYVKKLIGKGSQNPATKLLTINGAFTATKNGATVQNGTFSFQGKCK